MDPSIVSGHLKSMSACDPFSAHFPWEGRTAKGFKSKGEALEAANLSSSPLITSSWVVEVTCRVGQPLCTLVSPSVKWGWHLPHRAGSGNVLMCLAQSLATVITPYMLVLMISFRCQRILWGSKSFLMFCKPDLFLSSWWDSGDSYRLRTEKLGFLPQSFGISFESLFPHPQNGNNNIRLCLPHGILYMC